MAERNSKRTLLAYAIFFLLLDLGMRVIGVRAGFLEAFANLPILNSPFMVIAIILLAISSLSEKE